MGHHLRIYKRDSGINVKEGGVIQVIGLNWWLPFLRCSGRRVSRLKVAYENVPDACFEFRDHCISLYCADSLETILVKNFSKPFEKVIDVVLFRVRSRNQLPFFIDLLPNMGRLELRQVSMDENTLA